MTYKDLYDQMLNEVYDSELRDVPSWVTGGLSPAELMENNDPTAYRCEFADWLDTFNDSPAVCEDCREKIDSEFTINEMGMDDEVTCEVCRGLKFVCSECGSVLSYEAESEDAEVCKKCYDSKEEDERKEKDDENVDSHQSA